MSKPKPVAVVPSFDINVAHIRSYHRLAMNSAAQATCAAVMVGLELQKVKHGLRKSTPGCTFDAWLEENQESLGFARCTAFKYISLAENLKSKLLKAQDNSVIALIDKSSADLSDRQVKTLLLAIHKCVDGQSVSELYEEFGITRKQHGAPKRIAGVDHGGHDSPPTITVEEKITEQLELFGRFTEALDETAMIGGIRTLLITQWPKARLDEAINIAKRNLALLVKTRQAVKS